MRAFGVAGIQDMSATQVTEMVVGQKGVGECKAFQSICTGWIKVILDFLFNGRYDQ